MRGFTAPAQILSAKLAKFERLQRGAYWTVDLVEAWVVRHCSCASLLLCSFAQDETLCYYVNSKIFKPSPQTHTNFPPQQHIH